jgi:hypothetical protein
MRDRDGRRQQCSEVPAVSPSYPSAVSLERSSKPSRVLRFRPILQVDPQWSNRPWPVLFHLLILRARLWNRLRDLLSCQQAQQIYISIHALQQKAFLDWSRSYCFLPSYATCENQEESAEVFEID